MSMKLELAVQSLSNAVTRIDVELREIRQVLCALERRIHELEGLTGDGEAEKKASALTGVFLRPGRGPRRYDVMKDGVTVNDKPLRKEEAEEFARVELLGSDVLS